MENIFIRITSLTLVSLTFFLISCISQTNSEDYKKEDSIDFAVKLVEGGNYKIQNGDLKSGLDFYKKARMFNHSNSEILYKIANLNLQLGNFPIVISQCDTLEKEYSKNEELFTIYDIKSQAYSRMGKYYNALYFSNKEIDFIYNKKIEKKMDESLLSILYIDRAKIFIVLKNFEYAKSDLIKACKLDSLNCEIPLLQGQLALLNDENPDACHFFSIAKKLGCIEATDEIAKNCY